MLRYKYALTKQGAERCVKDEFYLQFSPKYKGYTEKIFRVLYESARPLTTREISELTGIRPRAVSGVINFNVQAGYIRRFTF
ncbi:MAG: hypothetical protein QW146_08495 [Candidatus Bathyarchaeia archaeon]